MAIVKIKILNREYPLACDEGEEDKLLNLVKNLDFRIQQNIRRFKGASEHTLLLLAALNVEDELEDLRQNNLKLQTQINKANETMGNNINRTFDEIAVYIDELANKIEML